MVYISLVFCEKYAKMSAGKRRQLFILATWNKIGEI